MPAAYLAPQSALGGVGPGLLDAVKGYKDIQEIGMNNQKAAYLPQQLKDQAETEQIKMKQIRAEESERVEKEQLANKQHNLISILQDQGLSKPSIDMLAKRLKEKGVTTEDPSVSGGAPFVKTKHLGASLKDAHDDIVFNTKIEKNELDDTNAKIADLKQSIQDKKVKDPEAANKQLKSWEDKATYHANTIFQMKTKIEQNAIATDQALLHKAGGDSKGIDPDTGQLNDAGKATIAAYAKLHEQDPVFRNEMAVYADSKKTGKDDYVQALKKEIDEQAKIPVKEAGKDPYKSAGGGVIFDPKTGKPSYVKPPKPDSDKTRFTSTNVTLKDGTTVTANFNARTGKYTDPDSGEDITKDVKTRAGVKKDKPEKEKGVVTALKNKANLSSDDLVKAVKSGSISREEALAIAKAKGIVQ